MHVFIVALLFFFQASANEKVLICGVCKDVASRALNTQKNIERLGSLFEDYHVIIYENNSNDNTPELFSAWAEKNDRVTFLSEVVPVQNLPSARTERIARARNKVLAQVKRVQYAEFSYVVMADLDFATEWPIDEIYQTIINGGDWDSVSANGAESNGVYYDCYAFRDSEYPLGPELLGREYWDSLRLYGVCVDESEPWLPVYSAFGGLAIYKRSSLLQASYSGSVTNDLKKYYQKILEATPKINFQLQAYRKMNRRSSKKKLKVVFQQNTPWDRPDPYKKITCCEHLTLHATMNLQGFGKFYVNPKMKMIYSFD